VEDLRGERKTYNTTNEEKEARKNKKEVERASTWRIFGWGSMRNRIVSVREVQRKQRAKLQRRGFLSREEVRS